MHVRHRDLRALAHAVGEAQGDVVLHDGRREDVERDIARLNRILAVVVIRAQREVAVVLIFDAGLQHIHVAPAESDARSACAEAARADARLGRRRAHAPRDIARVADGLDAAVVDSLETGCDRQFGCGYPRHADRYRGREEESQQAGNAWRG